MSANLGGVTNVHQRSREKKDLLLSWLADFHYSTQPLICTRLGVDPNGQRAFFNKLVKQGVLAHFNVPVLRERLFLLTSLGRDMALALSDKALVYQTDSSRVNPRSVRHNLSTQVAVLNRLKFCPTFTYERHLDFGKEKVPDAIMVCQEGIKVALEVELTHKKNARVWRAFLDHINCFKNGFYNKVEYVFATEALYKNYLAKFNEAGWPVYKRSGNGGLLQPVKAGNGKQKYFHPDEFDMRKNFKFTVEALHD